MLNNAIFSFIGVECYDILIYMARYLADHGSRVLLVDNSESKSLAVCVPGGYTAPSKSVIDYGGVTLVKDLETLPVSKFDVILAYYGRHGKNVSQNSSEVFAVLDYQKHSALSILDTVLPEDVPVTMIFRDQAFTKITEDAVVAYLEENGFRADASLYLEDPDTDVENRVLCQYNFFQPFDTISESMQSLLCDLLEVDVKELKGYLKSTARRR